MSFDMEWVLETWAFQLLAAALVQSLMLVNTVRNFWCVCV